MVVNVDITPAPDARTAALSGLLDDAGSPAVGAAAAVAAHGRHRRGPRAGMLGGLCWPAAGLEELAGALMPGLRSSEPPWRIVARSEEADAWIDGAAGAGARLADFRAEMEPAVVVEALQVPVPEGAVGDRFPGGVAEVVRALQLGDSTVPFFEVPGWDVGLMEAVLDGIAVARDATRRILGATIGGGPTWWPGRHRLAAFVDACRRRSLPMRLSGDRMPLLGIVAAAALSYRRGSPVAALERVLGERYPDRFILRGRHLVWSGVALDAGALRAMRRELLAGIAVESFPSAAAELAG